MKLAKRVGRISPSPTLRITSEAKALAARGVDVIDFASGEPDFDTPALVKEAGIAAIRSGFTKYTESAGIVELRSAVVDKLRRDQGLTYDKSQVLISCGAKHTLYNLAQALFEAGDEVIIPAPYWVSYPDQVLLNDATPVLVPTSEATGFQLTGDLLQRHVTARTKAVILNTPCNPTGTAYDRRALEAIAEVALRHGLLVVSDEIYEKLLYDGRTHVSIASLGPEIYAHTVVVNGVSKAYSMTGWRIGYAAGPKDLIAAMATVQSQSTSNPNSMAQKAAVVALHEGEPFIKGMVAEFDKRRRFMVDRLNTIPGIRCALPHGAFYAFPHVGNLFGRRSPDGPIDTANGLAAYLLKEARVAMVPGEAFGAPDHIRFSYATSMPNIVEGLERIEAAVNRLT
ncbi:MAG TPA: pyridoxal phosphate-dependent aminotransferase [Nitrospirales bacterium]|nr:pyridoxal phosphate-dependent aminotransferase [Nitrospirales bacterium]